jgi:hypothetical protein
MELFLFLEWQNLEQASIISILLNSDCLEIQLQSTKQPNY